MTLVGPNLGEIETELEEGEERREGGDRVF